MTKAGRPGPAGDGFGVGACAWDLGLDRRRGGPGTGVGRRMNEGGLDEKGSGQAWRCGGI